MIVYPGDCVNMVGQCSTLCGGLRVLGVCVATGNMARGRSSTCGEFGRLRLWMVAALNGPVCTHCVQNYIVLAAAAAAPLLVAPVQSL
jgi:hypothetical protein